MLPDFPTIKNRWSESVFRMILEQSRRGTILAKVRKTVHFEGSGMKSTDVTGTTKESNYNTLTSKLNIDRKDLIKRGPDSLEEGLRKMAEEFTIQQIRMLIEQIGVAAENTGNIVSAEGQELKRHHILQIFELIEMEFDENGNLNQLSALIPQEIYEKIMAKLREWENDEGFQLEYEKIISRKRQEWNDRESNRKLVD